MTQEDNIACWRHRCTVHSGNDRSRPASPSDKFRPDSCSACPHLRDQTPELARHPPTSAIANYAIGLEKLSANEQLFDFVQRWQ